MSLSNATFENQEMASYKLKQPYQILEKVTDKAEMNNGVRYLFDMRRVACSSTITSSLFAVALNAPVVVIGVRCDNFLPASTRGDDHSSTRGGL